MGPPYTKVLITPEVWAHEIKNEVLKRARDGKKEGEGERGAGGAVDAVMRG